MVNSNGDDNTDDFEIESINGESTGSKEGVASEEIAKELEKAKEELAKAKNDYLYLRADFENYKSQAIKERSEIAKFGAERLIVSLLEVVDNFERGLELSVTPENVNDFVDGMKLTSKELKSTLSKFGVQEFDPMGQPFDPNLHEALSSEETDTLPPGHVSRVFKKAYKMYDKVIRPAQVVVAKAPANKT